MNWVQGSLTDSDGLWDIAYVSLAAVTVLVLGAITFVCSMAAVDWWTCKPVLANNQLLQACRFDADAIGNAVGKICAAYAAALTALAAYMMATRRQPGTRTTVDVAATVQTKDINVGGT